MDDVYIIATCNDLSKVDVALLNRPSRFDKIYLVDDADTKQRRRFLKQYFPNITKKELKECYEKGIVLLNAGLYSNVLRILVPLVVAKEQLETG